MLGETQKVGFYLMRLRSRTRMLSRTRSEAVHVPFCPCSEIVSEVQFSRNRRPCFREGHFKTVTVRLCHCDCSLHYWGCENSKQEDRENVQFVGEMSMSRVNVTVKAVHTKPLCLLKRLVQLKRNLALCQASKKGTLRARPHPSKASAFKNTVSSYNFDACKTSSTWPRLSSSSADLERSLAPHFPWTTFTITSGEALFWAVAFREQAALSVVVSIRELFCQINSHFCKLEPYLVATFSVVAVQSRKPVFNNRGSFFNISFRLSSSLPAVVELFIFFPSPNCTYKYHFCPVCFCLSLRPWYGPRAIAMTQPEYSLVLKFPLKNTLVCSFLQDSSALRPGADKDPL